MTEKTMTHPKLVQAMRRPEFYPHRAEGVEFIQTHISYVFIVGDFVYKVKKPLDFGFLDFTSLEKRKYYCHEELRLNRRLAPHTYLDVVEICEDAEGHVALETGIRVIEYAVKMKTLPKEKMLKELLSQGKASPAVMDAIARKLVDFHRRAETGGNIDEAGSMETIKRNHDENFTATKPFINITIPEYQYAFIKSYIYNFMERHEPLFQKRVAEHKIRDGHGDLHLDHICIIDESILTGNINPDGIVVFDCIEFNERFRYDDVAAEVAFLAMDLDDNGYTDYSEAFVNAYIKHAEDTDIRLLLNFYKCYYAFFRGMVIGLKINDADIQEDEQKEAARTAAAYFDLAYTCAARLEKPTLILMAGLMGTGKSVRAKRIASRLGACVMQMDVLRKEILNIAPGERRREPFGNGIYADDISKLTYEKALEAAVALLKEGKSVIIDGSYKKRAERIKASEIAKKMNADFFIIECICPEDIIKERLDSRMADEKEASDGRWEIFQAQKNTFDAITEISDRSHVVIDASETPEEGAQQAIMAIRLAPSS